MKPKQKLSTYTLLSMLMSHVGLNRKFYWSDTIITFNLQDPATKNKSGFAFLPTVLSIVSKVQGRKEIINHANM